MSKSKGNVISPSPLRRALRRRHGALLHPVPRAARPGRRLVRRRRRRRAPLPRRGCGGWRPRSPAQAPAARARRGSPRAPTSSCCARRTGRSPRSPTTCGPLPLQHGDRGADGAVNEIYARAARGDAAPGALRFATATVASLLFPFAPHLGAEVYERLTGGRVWEAAVAEADAALLERDTVELVVQVNGKVRDRIEVAAPSAARGARGAARASAQRAAPPRRQARSSRRSSCRASSSTSSCAERLPNLKERDRVRACPISPYRWARTRPSSR